MTSVLWVTPHADPLLRSGGALRTARLIRELSRDLPVDVVVVGDPQIDTSLLREVSGARSVTWLPGTRGLAARRLALRRRWPLSVARMWDQQAHALVAAARDAVVVAEHPQAALYDPGRPYVLHLQNAEGRRVRELPLPTGLVPKIQRLWERSTLPRWEDFSVRHERASVVVVSDADAEVLGIRAHVVPNGTDLLPERELPDRGWPLFVGALDYAPNLAGLHWWCERVWPCLPAGTPRLRVVGRGGHQALGALAGHPGLEVVGEVEDLRPHYEGAGLAVVPLLHGGGTRLKVLEAMAWSVPVLSTAKGAEGLDLEPGVDLAVADAPEEFAARLTAVLNTPAGRELGRAGRHAVVKYSWTTLGAELRRLVAELAAA